jgi:two-component system NtrC family response regulator
MKKRKKLSAKPLNGLKILFADDEAPLQELMSLELPRMGHEATICPDGLTAIAALDRNSYDCLIVDLDMPGMNGIEVIERVKTDSPDTEAIVLTGKASKDSAIAALRHGAFDYLTKPCTLADLETLLKRVAEKRELTNKYRALKRQLERIEGKTDMVGEGLGMQRVRDLIAKVAPTNSTVLILGETGTGKELAARSVHEQSTRADMPFVAVNCGALPEQLIESELFGHRKGAFTGADENRTGLFEVANNGTLFLDEIGELPKSLQAKLLRVLESGEIRRVGDNESFKVDVRIVCATHRMLPQMVESGEFREDLMYRINTFEVTLPPLRDRKSDIPLIATHLFKRFCRTNHSTDLIFSQQVIESLENHIWPGNIRELANVIEHASIVCDQLPIKLEHLPRQFDARKLTGTSKPSFGAMTLRDIEMAAIDASLERNAGNKVEAAEELGVSLKTLYNKLNQQAESRRAA